MSPRKPQVGDWACHKSNVVDPRRVAEVSADGKKIKLHIGDLTTSWLSADYYHFKEN